MLFLMILRYLRAGALSASRASGSGLSDTDAAPHCPQDSIGLVAAGFVAATMAAVASTLNSAATIITMDVVKRIIPACGEG